VVLNGYVGKDKLYEIINDKLLNLNITEDSYPLYSFKVAEAYKEKLRIELQPFPNPLLGGLLYKDPDDVMNFMAINSLKSKKSQNFDVMHELCHYWIHDAGEHLCYDSNFIFQNKGIEWQANEGAAQALMPENLFKQMYIYFSGDTNKLSDYFIVSKTAVEYRIKNLKLFPPSKLRGLLYKSKKAHHCLVCGNLEIKRFDNYCKICGNDMFSFGTSYTWSVYSDVSADENRCPECKEYLDRNARYYRHCGSASMLFNFLRPWYEDIMFIEKHPNVLKCL